MAITLYPFIFGSKKEKADPVLMNHEKIHLEQEKELLVIPFYIIYLANSLWLLIKHLSFDMAYRLNIFEVEAYTHERDFGWTVNRDRYCYFKYDLSTEAYKKSVLKRKVKTTEKIFAMAFLAILSCLILVSIIAI